MNPQSINEPTSTLGCLKNFLRQFSYICMAEMYCRCSTYTWAMFNQTSQNSAVASRTYVATNESANPRIHESANPRIHKSSNPRILESTNPRINESTNQQINESTNQRINESTKQRNNKSTNQRKKLDFLQAL